MKLRVNYLIIRVCVDRLLSANRTEFISSFLNIRFHICQRNDKQKSKQWKI